jgi:hypothetical protein
MRFLHFFRIHFLFFERFVQFPEDFTDYKSMLWKFEHPQFCFAAGKILARQLSQFERIQDQVDNTLI